MSAPAEKAITIDYSAAREFARIRAEEFGPRSRVFLQHPNPVTGEICPGPLIISYSSFRSRQAQNALDIIGQIPSTCLSCGASPNIGPDKQLINSST